MSSFDSSRSASLLSESYEAEVARIPYDAVDSAVDDIDDNVDVLVGVSV